MQSAVDQGNFIKTVSPAFHEGLREEIEATIYKHSTKDDLSLELLILNVANGYKEAIIEQYEVLKTVFEQEYNSEFYPLSTHELLTGNMFSRVLTEYKQYLPGFNSINR